MSPSHPHHRHCHRIAVPPYFFVFTSPDFVVLSSTPTFGLMSCWDFGKRRRRVSSPERGERHQTGFYFTFSSVYSRNVTKQANNQTSLRLHHETKSLSILLLLLLFLLLERKDDVGLAWFGLVSLSYSKSSQVRLEPAKPALDPKLEKEGRRAAYSVAIYWLSLSSMLLCKPLFEMRRTGEAAVEEKGMWMRMHLLK